MSFKYICENCSNEFYPPWWKGSSVESECVFCGSQGINEVRISYQEYYNDMVKKIPRRELGGG
ncbi:hypothetical protein [Natranaerobius trueperi]|uniref:Zinc ribbon domain-containing protein n=1 Tax=Natranaerobius trueperi TaxID=759412 RepID=A0A226C0F9_9FIRM|nr:hypothetical protein [Natranaerobius trueperi]OWZ83939.1 hypothetical protein CDO51_06010 [Natranaerobius trueperi]